jgi:hypothetical protein
MSGPISLLTSLELTPLYEVIQSYSLVVAMYVSPTLLIIAIYVRTVETQLDALVSGGKWAAAIRDMVGWGTVLALYAAIGYYVIDSMNAIYDWAEKLGSLKTMMEQFDVIVSKVEGRMKTDSPSALDFLSTPYLLFTSMMYYVTIILVQFVALFLKVANVMVYGIAYIWGLIAIPMSISTTFRLLRGWGLLMGLALVWPFVLAMSLAIFSLLFSNAANVLVLDTEANAAATLGSVYMLYSILNLVTIAVLVASPFIAQALVANTPAVAGVVTPFVGAALASGAATAKASSGTAGFAGRHAGKAIAERFGSMFDQDKKPASNIPKSRAVSSSAAISSPTGSSSQVGASSEGVDSDSASSAPPQTASDTNDGTLKSRRDKRNAIIKQTLKRR